MDTIIGGYTIRRVAFFGWGLFLTSTGERLRTYTTFEHAANDARRYINLTTNLDRG